MSGKKNLHEGSILYFGLNVCKKTGTKKSTASTKYFVFNAKSICTVTTELNYQEQSDNIKQKHALYCKVGLDASSSVIYRVEGCHLILMQCFFAMDNHDILIAGAPNDNFWKISVRKTI